MTFIYQVFNLKKEVRMFKIKAPKSQKLRLQELLNIADSQNYQYVLTMDKSLTEPHKINILFNEKDVKDIKEMISLILKTEDISIQVYDEFGQKQLPSSLVDYFIVEEDDLVVFSKTDKYFIKMKLYEIEELVQNKTFIRVSKYAIVNINQIEYIKPAMNSKLTLLMKNGHSLEVNRSYYKNFKKTLNL